MTEPGEKTIEWESFDEKDKQTIIEAMCNHAGYKRCDNLLRIMNIGKPKIIIGKGKYGCYCRVHKDSESIIELLLKNYL